MAQYFEYIGSNDRAIIDDATSRYIKSRSVIASSLDSLIDDGGGHGLTARQEENLMYLIPNANRKYMLCVMPLALADGESLVSINTDLVDEYIGYSVRSPISSDNIAYIYIFIGRGATIKDMGLVRSHLIINLYTSVIPPHGNVGLNVFNEKGAMVFNSNNDVMSIKYFYNNLDVTNGNIGTGVYFYNNMAVWNSIPNLGIIYRKEKSDSVCINNLPGGVIFGGNYSAGGATFSISGYISFTPLGISAMFAVGAFNILNTQYEFGIWTDIVSGKEMPEWTKVLNAQFGKSLCVSIVR